MEASELANHISEELEASYPPVSCGLSVAHINSARELFLAEAEL